MGLAPDALSLLSNPLSELQLTDSFAPVAQSIRCHLPQDFVLALQSVPLEKKGTHQEKRSSVPRAPHYQLMRLLRQLLSEVSKSGSLAANRLFLEFEVQLPLCHFGLL